MLPIVNITCVGLALDDLFELSEYLLKRMIRAAPHSVRQVDSEEHSRNYTANHYQVFCHVIYSLPRQGIVTIWFGPALNEW